MSILGDRSRPTHRSLNWVWDTGLLDWVVMTQPGGSGGGGAVTIADGANVVEGSVGDVAVQGDNAGTISAKLRGLNKSIAAGIAVTGPLTDAQLRATPVPVSGTVAISGSVAVTNAGLTNLDVALSTRTKPSDQQHVIIDSSASIAVTGPLTDTQLRASPVPVSGPLTDTQLRATPVPVSGTVSVSGSIVNGVIAPTGPSTWNNATALNTAITVAAAGYGVVMFKGSPTSSPNGRVSFEGSTDGGTTYEACTASILQVNPASVAVNNPNLYSDFNMNTLSTAWIAYVNVQAYTHVRARLSITISGGGSLVISGVTSALPTTQGLPGGINIFGIPYPSSASNLANLPVMTTGTSTNGLLVALVDAVNNVSTIKAASTLPLTTDTALVVTLRNGLPAGAAVIGHVITDSGSVAAVTGAVTANATATAQPPTYVEAAASALSQDLSGRLRVVQTSSVQGDIAMLQLLGQVVAELKAMRLQLVLMGDPSSFVDTDSSATPFALLN